MEFQTTESPIEEIDIWSLVGKCVFCYKPSNGEHKLLKCLHLVCSTCKVTHMTQHGVACRCLVISSEQIDYTITSPDVQCIKICNTNNCTESVKKLCALCRLFCCEPCAIKHEEEFHLNDNEHVIVNYPLTRDLSLCKSCSTKFVDLYCNKCRIMTCSLCHLMHHENHEYIILENYSHEIKQEISSKKSSLINNNLYLTYCKDLVNKDIENLEIKKKSLYDEIDNNINDIQTKLLNELNKRKFELKCMVDNEIEITKNSLNENIHIYHDFKKKNDYYIGLTESIINNGKTNDIIMLSRAFMNKLNSINIENVHLKVKDKKFNMQLNCNNEVMETFISNIKECLEGIQLSKSNTNILNDHPIHVFDGQEITLEDSIDDIQPNNSINVDIDSDLINANLPGCSCCNQNIKLELSHKCIECKRHYHDYCHIPRIPSHYLNDEKIRTSWKCTMCKDITPIIMSLKQQSNLADFSFGHLEQTIINRILLELYCQNSNSQHFRNCPDQIYYPGYYEKVIQPISLNDIKIRLETNTPRYAYINDVLKDLMLVFTNALSYYPSHDPNYIAASSLRDYLINMINQWLPNLKNFFTYYEL